ncbi:MAG TPA: hypothetical protein VN673_06840, partial [Clostridia bacterium]|nr:hypothetical protein [Clostridia bacterium]
TRLHFTITPEGLIQGESVPQGLLASILTTEEMLPCVGQGAIGLEIREGDDRLATICERLNDTDTFYCVTAERSFLAAMGGGCQSPVAAYAAVDHSNIKMRALSFASGPVRRAEAQKPAAQAAELGWDLATTLKGAA